jgi:hypothetical protein
VPDKPKAPEKSQTFFADEHFNLMRRNPNQMEAPALTVVSDVPATGAGVDRSHRAKAAASS